MVLVSSISNFFVIKMSLANKWMRKKIPSFCNLALGIYFLSIYSFCWIADEIIFVIVGAQNFVEFN